MVWLHPSLLVGLALVAVPVLLHLLMRAKPKKLVFPALRLIQNRKRTNVRRLRLRHWALMLLRMAVLALLVLLVARPSVPAADYSLSRSDCLRILLLGAVAVGLYFGLLAWWKKRAVPAHELTYRRSLLRGAIFVAGALAMLLLVAWPYQQRITAAVTQPTLAPSEFLPVAAAMLFDTSLSMQYRHENRTRLEVAQEIAARHVGALPRLSRVAICDTAETSPIRFQSDLSGAARRIAGLAVQPLSQPLDDRLLAAIEAHIEDEERQGGGVEGGARPAATGLLREVYIFTDLTEAAWRREEFPRLKEALARLPSLGVYLIDVGVSEPTNVGVTGLTLSEQAAPQGSEVVLRATLEALGGEPGERVVELHAENESGKMVKLGQQSLRIDPSTATTAQFQLRAAGGPLVQGELRLLASDPLSFDDMRAFTFRVQPAAEMLLVADVKDETVWVGDALAPSELVRLGKQRYRCDVLASTKLAGADLARYSVVWLLNVADPTVDGWANVERYVAQGGSAVIVLGHRVRHEAYLVDAAKEVLPGELQAVRRFDPPEFLDLKDFTHPLLKRFADYEGGAAELNAVPILNCWAVTPEPRNSSVIATFTDNRRSPAIVERALGSGRVLMFTTAFDRRWNELPVAGWQYVALLDQTARYLSRTSGDNYNYTIGENVVVRIDRDESLAAYLLRKPGLQQLRQEAPPGARHFTVQAVDQLGNYRLSGAEPQSKFERGFSVNADGAESRLKRLSKPELDARLGEERYSVARDIENLQRNVRTGRLGREAFPLLAVLLLSAFLGEHFLANRFYDEGQHNA